MKATNDVVIWLLDSHIASIRYLTHRDLSGADTESELLRSEYAAIQDSDPVMSILSEQKTPGRWQHLEHYYSPKYRSTHWTLMLLEELQADPHSHAFQEGVEFILTRTQELVEERTKKEDPGFTCLFGNIIRYAVYAGFLQDTRTQAMIKLVINSLDQSDCSCQYNTNLPCSWGAARSLWGLAIIPESSRNAATQQAILTGVDFLTQKYDLVRANYPHPEGGKIHPIWSTLNFPLFYHADILFVLRVMKQFGHLDKPQLKPAKDWLRARRNQNGRWSGSSPYQSRTWSLSSDKEDTSRWITLQALSVLN